MLKSLFWLCLTITNVLVAANPRLLTVPSQSCPICQQNAYQSIPTNIPYVIQQPTASFNPYSQTNWAQNPVAQTCQQPQVVPTYINQVSSSNNQLNQEIFRNILSNPALRNILNPNTKLYNQNGVEIPRSGPNTASVPNVINNYIIVPPELLLNNTKVNQNNRETKVRNGEQRKRNNSNRNQCETTPSRRKHHENNGSGKDTTERSKNQRGRNDSRRDNVQRKRKTTQNESEINLDDVEVDRNRQKSRRRPKNKPKNEERKSSNLNKDVSIENVSDKLEVEESDKIQINEKDNDDKNIHYPATISLSESPTNENNLNIINYQNYELALEQYNSKLNAKAGTDNIENPNNSDHSSSQPSKMEDRKARTNVEIPKRKKNRQNAGNLKTNAVQRNPREEAVIQDFHAKFPGIPEEVIRSLLSHLKRHLQNEQLGTSNFYYPGFPMNYEQLYQTQFSGANNNGRNNNGRNKNSKRKNRKNQNNHKEQRRNTNISETTVEPTPSLMENESENITPTSTQNSIPIEENTEELLREEVTTELDDSIKIKTSKSPPRFTENMDHNTKVPELGTEDIVPTIYVNGIIDDYYPDFTAGNDAFLISQEEYGLANLQEDRYHYTTDKNYEIEELNIERRKFEPNFHDNHYSKQHLKEDSNYKSHRTNNREQYITSREDIEEIQFRTPPTLELPDFETRRVDKVTNYEEEFDDDDDNEDFDRFLDKYSDRVDKGSTYSNFKTPQYNTDKPSNDRRSSGKRAKSEVETVFARSKVAKYGQTPDFSEEVTTPISRERAAKNERYQYTTDQKPSIVIAKSIPGEY